MKQQLMRNGFLFILLMGLTSAVFAQPTVTSTNPSKNQNAVSESGNISITFSEAMNTSTLTASTIKVKGSISGSHAGSISFSNGDATVTFNPTSDFTFGESVTVTVTTGAKNASDVALSNSFSWSFITKTLTNGASYTSTTYTTGYGPRDVRMADVDGDADNDLVVLNYDWDNVSVLKNNGDGTFATKTDYPLGDNPLFLALADVDNDNDIDIISTNSFGLSLSVLKNNGNGTFAAKVDYATPYQSRTVSAADVNGDGFADLIAPTESKDSVSVFMNNGDGTFADDVEYLTGDGPFGITVADVDGDGDMDLATGNFASSTVSVLKNNGDGTYAAKSEYGTGSSPRALTNADVDNDGDADIIVAYISGVSSGGVSVLKNNGDGTFAAKVDYPTSYGSFNPVAQDIDGDGDIDIVNANAAPGNNFSLLKNNGDGTFAAKVDYLSSTNMYAVAAGDLDGNGIVDFAAGQAGTNLVTVMLNILPPSVTSVSPVKNANYVSTSTNIEITFDQAMFADSINARTILVNGSQSGNHDGAISYNSGSHSAVFNPADDFEPGELVTVSVSTSVQNSKKAGLTSPYIYQFYTYLKGDLIANQNSKFNPGTKPYGASHADLDSDGDLDMILPLAEKDSISILTNDGSGNYSTLTQIYSGSGTLPYHVSTGDYNYDGQIDFAVSNYSSANIEVYLNTGSLTFSRTTYGAQSGTIASVSVDLDGDGDIDIAAYNRQGGTVSIFRNNGNGTFASAVNTSFIDYNASKMRSADVDNDHDLDLVISGLNANITIVKNNGDGTFTTSVNTGMNNADDVQFNDLDNDGDMDMVSVYQTGGKVTISLNNGNGTFAAGLDFSFTNPNSVAFMDLSHDGDIDIIVSAQDVEYYDQIEYLVNDGNTNFSNEYGFYDLLTDYEYSFAGYPALSTADVDGDGDLDLVMASRLKSYVAINKSSDFVTVTALSPVPNSNGISSSTNLTAVLNYDVNPVTVNSSSVLVTGSLSGKISGTVSYNSPTKTITFDPSSNFIPGETVMMAVSDSVTSLNGTHLNAGKATEFTVAVSSSGKGHFVLNSTRNFESGHYPSAMSTGDLNGDGMADAVFVEPYNNGVSVALNNGDGTFAAPVTLSYSVNSLSYINLADIDADGDLDILIGRYGNASIAVLTNDGNASFQEAEYSVNTFSSYYDNLYSKDLNADGLPDVIQRNSGSSGPLYSINLGDGQFQGDIKQIDWSSSDLAITDLDNDGDQDFIMSYNSSGYHRLGIALNKGVREGIYPDYGDPYFIELDIAPKLIKAADVDADGDIDFVATSADDLSFFVIKNNGDGTYTTMSPVKVELQISAMEAGDLNGDGDIDLIFTSNSSNDNGETNIHVAYNNGNGDFSNTASFIIPNYSSTKQVKLGDADGDGDLDLIALYGGYINSDYVVTLGVYTNTVSSAPDSEATNISFSQNFGSKITVNWNKGSGTRHLVVVKAGSAVDAVPSNTGNYNPSAVYGEGSDIGSGNYVVYAGGGSTVTVSGLSTSTVYHFSVFELNGNEGDEAFYSTNAPVGSVTTNAKEGYAFETTPGSALAFDGSSSVAEYYHEDDLPQDMTIEMWVKVADSSSTAAFFTRGDSQGISEGSGKVSIRPSSKKGNGNTHSKVSEVAPNGNADYNYPIHLGVNNGHFYASVYDDDAGDPVNLNGTADVYSNKWYHVALTMKYNSENGETSVHFYVNGNEDAEAKTVYDFYDSQESIILGYDGNSYFHGEIDELQIRSNVQTIGEIRSSMHKTLSGFPANLFGYFQFNEGSGTTASQLANSDKFYLNNNVSWISSSIPVGEGTSTSASSFTTGTQTVGNTTLEMEDGFDNPVDIVVTEVTGDPNIFPEGYSSSAGGKIFVIELFGDPGTFTASLTLNYGSGVLDESVNSNPSQMRLYKRSSTSSASWTELGGATSADYATGIVTWTGITSFSQFISVNESNALPVELSSFSANLVENKVSLNWATATETNNSGWEIEMLGTGNREHGTWKKVGFVAGKGTTTEEQSYSFAVSNLTGSKAEFRLKQIDADGSVSYSEVLSVDLVPSRFELSQNYPNPFNPTTAIRYSLPVAGHVELAVYNMLGQKIMTLVNTEKEAGYHIFSFDGRNLASGSYFYVLNAGNFHSVKKFMLMK